LEMTSMSLRESIFLDRMLRVPWMEREKLKKLRAGVVGLGNIGSSVAVMLHGLGLKELWLIDKDEVELSNVQRQFMYSERDTGRPKAIAAREFLESRFGELGTEIKAVVADVRFMDLNLDFIFCCVDNNSARKAVLEKCLKKEIPLIDTGLEFNESQAGHVLLVDRKRFPEGACTNCYLDLSRNDPRAGCIAAGVPYSGPAIASVAVAVFVHHVMKGIRVNFYFIDFNSMHAEFGFLRKRRSCGVCGNE